MPESMAWIWLGAMIFFIFLEASTVSLVSLWFVGGSLAAMITALCGGDLWLQIVLFIVVSSILLLSLRPLARKYLRPRQERTNAQSNIGKTAVVTESIDNLHGQGAVKISGVYWSARSENGEIIDNGEVVRVTAIEGAKVRVERLPKEKHKK